MEKLDLEAILFMHILKLKEQKDKTYSPEECDQHIAYVFDDYKSYEDYFLDNGIEPAYIYKVCDICEMRTTKNGSIIALKGLCDHSISILNQSSIKNTGIIKR